MQVNVLVAKNQLSQLIKSAQSGEDIVIANRGVPVVRLVPMTTPAPPGTAVGSARRWLEWLDAHPLPAHLHRGHEAIEASIQGERAAWD